jgi:hypothetical protein
VIENPQENCPLCNRLMYHVSDHHLVPKSRGGKETLAICCDCHRAIHSLFSNKELERKYNTVEALLSDERFSKMAVFLSKQDPRRRSRAKRARDNKKRGRSG